MCVKESIENIFVYSFGTAEKEKNVLIDDRKREEEKREGERPIGMRNLPMCFFSFVNQISLWNISTSWRDDNNRHCLDLSDDN